MSKQDEGGAVEANERLVTFSVDLTNSTLGPVWRGVEVAAAWPWDRDPHELQRMAADHYGVPLDQVSHPHRV